MFKIVCYIPLRPDLHNCVGDPKIEKKKFFPLFVWFKGEPAHLCDFICFRCFEKIRLDDTSGTTELVLLFLWRLHHFVPKDE